MKLTKKEWDVIITAKMLSPLDGEKLIINFFTPRLEKILETDEIQDFEKEKDLIFEEVCCPNKKSPQLTPINRLIDPF